MPTSAARSRNHLSRRHVLGGSLAGLAAALTGLPPLRAARAEPLVLEARPGLARLRGPGLEPTAVWGFGGAVPGPLVRVRQGEEVVARLVNRLDQPTTIHWHGIRIANAMDGVPHMTQPAVAPGESFEYRFRVPDAGTFWYHPHERSYEQVPMGLFGALVVDEPAPPKADRDLLLVVNDWRLGSDGQSTGGFGSRHDQMHGGRLGNTLTVNAEPPAEIPVARHERVRLRLVNTSTARILRLAAEGAAPRLIAFDGQPLGPTARYGATLVLGPGNRADLMLDMAGEPGEAIRLVEVSYAPEVLATFRLTAEAARPEPLAAPLELAANPLVLPTAADALAVELAMTGGAAHESDMSLMMGSGPIWALNGVSGMAAEPLFRAPRGRSVRLRMTNATAFAHAMHVHGHHFRLLERTGGPAPEPFWWDTLLVGKGETVVLGFVADNPGKWMIHCHMLDHQAAGMDTWFEVV